MSEINNEIIRMYNSIVGFTGTPDVPSQWWTQKKDTYREQAVMVREMITYALDNIDHASCTIAEVRVMLLQEKTVYIMTPEILASINPGAIIVYCMMQLIKHFSIYSGLRSSEFYRYAAIYENRIFTARYENKQVRL
jgi:hypothetical protein